MQSQLLRAWKVGLGPYHTAGRQAGPWAGMGWQAAWGTPRGLGLGLLPKALLAPQLISRRDHKSGAPNNPT